MLLGTWGDKVGRPNMTLSNVCKGETPSGLADKFPMPQCKKSASRLKAGENDRSR